MNSLFSRLGQRWYAAAGIVAGLLLLITNPVFPDPDMFHEMALIRESLRLGYIPQVDLFAYTPTIAPSMHHEWGTGAVLYFTIVTCGLGGAGLLLLKYLLTGTVLSGCLICARHEGAAGSICFFLAPVAIILGQIGFTTIRAQLFTMVFLTVLMLFFSMDRRGTRWWVLVWVPMFVVWLNMHAGVVAGVGLYGLHFMEQFVRQLVARRSVYGALCATSHLIAGGLAIIPLFGVNPYGYEFVPVMIEGIRLKRPLILEWGPLWTAPDPTLGLLTYALSIAVVAYAAYQRGWTKLHGLPMVLVGAWLALTHIRHSSIYAVIWICHAPGFLTGTNLATQLERMWDERRGLITAVSASVVLYFACLATSGRPWELYFPTTEPVGPLLYPVGAVDYLERADFRGNVMTPFRAGAYVSWRMYPAVKISLDGRFEVAYPTESLAENFDFYAAAPGWLDTLHRYKTDAVLVPTATKLCDLLVDEAGWACVYKDDGYSVMVPPSAAGALPVENRLGLPIIASFP
jgi:hypothetical protein